MQSDPQTGTRCALWWCLRESELPHPHGAAHAAGRLPFLAARKGHFQGQPISYFSGKEVTVGNLPKPSLPSEATVIFK